MPCTAAPNRWSPGKATGIGIGVWPNYGLCNWFELALNNGVDPRTGVQIGPKCGDLTTFDSIEDVKAAFEQQVAFFAEIVATASNVVIPVRAELNPMPLSLGLYRPPPRPVPRTSPPAGRPTITTPR